MNNQQLKQIKIHLRSRDKTRKKQNEELNQIIINQQ